MDKSNIKKWIDRVIGFDGILRIQSWWANRLLTNILDYIDSSIQSVKNALNSFTNAQVITIPDNATDDIEWLTEFHYTLKDWESVGDMRKISILNMTSDPVSYEEFVNNGVNVSKISNIGNGINEESFTLHLKTTQINQTSYQYVDLTSNTTKSLKFGRGLYYQSDTNNFEVGLAIPILTVDPNEYTNGYIAFKYAGNNDIYTYIKEPVGNKWVVANRPKIVNITYKALVEASSTNSLVPGQQYRITDYTTITVQPNTHSTSRAFDLIVTATDSKTLDPKAKVALSARNTYFNNSNVSMWQVWYDLHGDDFNWTNALTDYAVHVQLPLALRQEIALYFGVSDTNIPTPLTFTYWKDDVNKNHLFKAENVPSDDYIVTLQYDNSQSIANNVIPSGNLRGNMLSLQYRDLNGGVWYTSNTSSSITVDRLIKHKGVIYRMIDEFGNDCPYDFKNIQFKNPTDENDESWYYTFSEVDTSGRISDKSLRKNCTNNIIKAYYVDKKFFLNNNICVTSNTDVCKGNTFETDTANNIFKSSCMYNTVGCGCTYNTCTINYTHNVLLDSGCSYLNITSQNDSVKNVRITSVIKGDSENINDVPITDSGDYQTIIASDKRGEIKQFCLTDLITTA